MRRIFLTHVPMTTLPVALLRPVTECEDAVSFQLHFRLLFNFFCNSSFLGFPKSSQQGSEMSAFQFRLLWDHTVSIPAWHSYYNKTKEMEQGKSVFGNLNSQLHKFQCQFIHNYNLSRNLRDKKQEVFPDRVSLSPMPQLEQM